MSLIRVHFILNLKNCSPFKQVDIDYLVLCCLSEVSSKNFNQAF